MRHVLVVLGTRPEAVKLAPVIQALQARPEHFKTIVCDVGQHRDMVQHILALFGISPDERLDIMQFSQTLFHVTSRALLQLETVLNRLAPDIVLVQGDTSTAMTAALAAFYSKVPVGHVEAGLRTYDKSAPYPEEVNRRLIGVLADYHFAPTEQARQNLLNELIPEKDIYVTGNTVVDALLALKAQMTSSISEDFYVEFRNLYNLDLEKGRMILITCHRRESFGEGLRRICAAISDLSMLYPNISFVYPVHPNPNVEIVVKKELSNRSNVFLIPPQTYDRFLFLMAHCKLLLTDSGGVQEEAYVFKKPLVVLRSVTERMEAVQAGYAWLVGSDREAIVERTKRILEAIEDGVDFFVCSNPYGDGKASERITNVLRCAIPGRNRRFTG